MFENVIGYEYVKKELELIISWYTNEEYLANENAKLPNGIIFHGRPGNGKTLFIRELASFFKDSAFILNGDEENILSEITETYRKAREKKIALVLIDEIDLLLDKSRKILRVLQDELDGIGKGNERILTIATTNHLGDLPETLLRPGRIDRRIKIGMPNPDEIKLLLEYYFGKLNVKLEIDDLGWIAKYLSNKSCAEIMALCNDCYFRFKGEKVDEAKIYLSLSKIDSYGPLLDENKPRSKQVAYHEIGHALLNLRYKEYFTLLEVRFSDDGAFCKCSFNKDIEYGMKSRIADITVTLGGIIVERLFFDDVYDGAEFDLEKAREDVNYLVNRFPYKRITNVLKRYDNESRMETEKSRYLNEKIGNKLFNKCYKDAYKYLKKHKNEIIKYGDLLVEKGRLMASDFNI